MATGKIVFSSSAIGNLPTPAAGRDIWHDAKTPGLQLRVTHTGTKTFSWFRRMPHGDMERVTLGRWPDLNVEEARRHAARLSGGAADGINPAEKRRDANLEMTFADLFQIYMARWAKVRKATWRDDESKYRIHLIPLHQKRLSAITRRDVATIHSKIGMDQPTFANRVLALVSKVFNVATEYGLWDGDNPAKGIRHFREQSRDRFLSGDELMRFMDSLNEEPDFLKSFFLVTLMTGARRANVMAMRWEDLDLNGEVWKIPITKNGRPVHVPLVPMVTRVLAGLREAGQESEWVFSSKKSTSGHIVNPDKAWDRIIARAGIEDAHIHDLRRTMGSWQAITGASLPIIGKSLGHQSQQATAIYARLDLDPVRAAMGKAASAMEEAMTGGTKQS